MSVLDQLLAPSDEWAVDDPGDREQDEVLLLACGTLAPGLVHDPCQHSRLYVQCCRCAGCMFDLWACDVPDPDDDWYQAWWIADQVEPWLRHRYAMLVYALLAVFMLASGAVQAILESVMILMVLTGWALILVFHVLLG